MTDNEIICFEDLSQSEKDQFINVQMALFLEYGAGMRERSQPEYLFTAAAIGSFGAVAWGVAAIDPTRYSARYFLLQPAYLAAFGILFGCIVVIAKIVRENRRYMRFRHQRAEIAKNISSIKGNAFRVPEELLYDGHGRGYLFSCAIILAFAIAASAFCISIVRDAT